MASMKLCSTVCSAPIFKNVQSIHRILWSWKLFLYSETQYFSGWPNRIIGLKKPTDDGLHFWILNGAGTLFPKPTATAGSADAYTSTTTTKANASITPGRTVRESDYQEIKLTNNFIPFGIMLYDNQKVLEFFKFVTWSNGTAIGGPIMLDDASVAMEMGSPSALFRYNETTARIVGMCRTFASACLCCCLVCIGVTSRQCFCFRN